jgi:hypothetical protein
MSAEWNPSVQESRLGQEGYLHYLAGLAILNTPSSQFALDLLGQGERTSEDVIVAAESLMYRGLQSVIKYSNPPGSLADARGGFNEALPRMFHIVDSTYELHEDRIGSINHAFYGIRPAPMFVEGYYKMLCDGNRTKILTSHLLDGILPAVQFTDVLRDRHVGDHAVPHLTS